MNRLKLGIVLGFAIMFVAGLAVGHSGKAVIPATSKPDPLPLMGDRLHLTSDQKAKVESIWKDARARADRSKQFQALDQERDAAIHAMLTTEQQKQYDQIQAGHKARVADLRGEVGKIIDEAREKTRPLLTPEQRETFDTMVKEHHHGPPGPGMPPGMMMGAGGHHHPRPGAETKPATAPTSQETSRSFPSSGPRTVASESYCGSV